MELDFFKIDDLWVAEFEVAGDFNLHIERANEGRMRIYQRTSGVKYKNIDATGWLDKILVFDSDFAGVVYPKSIKVESKSKPHVAIVTSESDITIIKPKIKFSVGDANFEIDYGTTWSAFIKENRETEFQYNGTNVRLSDSGLDEKIVYGYQHDNYAISEFPSGYIAMNGVPVIEGEIKAGHYDFVGYPCSFNVDDLQVTCEEYMTWGNFKESIFNGQVLTVTNYGLEDIAIRNENGVVTQLKTENGGAVYENQFIVNGATYKGYREVPEDAPDANTMTIDGVEYNFNLGDDWNSWMFSSNSNGEYRDYFIDDTAENRVMHKTSYKYVTDESGRYVVIDDKIIKGHAYKLK